ncbi:uncharacterized skeletal organic matrix protein 5-like, partial [Stylophora pistillata]|uniref:uncharacterized skeletal organic matrix protein 5-like n=1 Tax=Stylophora pistillata TaxID=50429 RepID=UPI000C03BE99
CACHFGYTGNKCKIGNSCSNLLDSSEGNRAYSLTVGSVSLPVYCHMTSLGACGGGGWTLVMKINGNKGTFHYDSKYWSDKNFFNLVGGRTGFDSQETKLPTYWNTPFSKICLGMKVNQKQPNFIVINKKADSLYSLIADGKHRNTSLGRDTWKTLIGSQASLQLYCNMEGFNCDCVKAKTRIGIVANEYANACDYCDSRIGFGGAGVYDVNNTCGNVAVWYPDNGERYTRAMGYIFVQ